MIAVDAARRHYVDTDSAHGFDHVLRVWRLAERIGRAEGADLEILRAAALLHDVARPEEARTGVDHAQASARRAEEILSGAPAEQVARVAQAIREHRFRGAVRPTTIEGRALFDADKLDAIGAIGVARAYAVAGARRQRVWADVDAAYAERAPVLGRDDLASDEHTPVHEYLFKLVRLRDLMQTDTGQRMADHRHRVMVAFFEELDREVRGAR